MKHLHRIHLLTALLIPIVSLATGAMLLGDMFTAVLQERLGSAIERATVTARQNAAIEATGEEQEKEEREARRRVQELGRKKRVVRLELSALLSTIKNTGNRRDQLLLSQELTLRTLERQQSDFASLLRFAQARGDLAVAGPRLGGWITRRLLGFSLGERIDADLRDDALASARKEILERLAIAYEAAILSREKLHASAGDLADEVSAMRRTHDSLRRQYADALRTLDRAQRAVRASAEQLAEVRKQQEDVQADLLRMQGELDRIDGRLRAKAERELVQKGLMEDRPERFQQKRFTGKGQFVWPVSGPISAGFHDARYQKFFGLPHQGIDIVVPFSSSVLAASDGIVFTVRPGGATGYTYVLIGHRGRYATVYGHLSEVTVQAGDTVRAGEIIGNSGGTPGTEGAGRMTTGAHLHFEMILRGEHIDPVSVLP